MSAEGNSADQEEYLRRCASLLRTMTHEGRCGVVLQDFKAIVEALNRLDWLAEQMEAECGTGDGAASSGAPGATSKSYRLSLELRQEQSEHDRLESTPTLAAPATVPPELPPSDSKETTAPVPFCSGDVWQRPDGKAAFRIYSADEEWVELEWFVNGHFKAHDRFPVRDLLIFVRENGIATVGRTG